MTDARYPERWLHDRRFRTLPAEPHVTYVLCLAMAVGNRSEGFVSVDDLAHLRRSPADAETLVIAGLWDVESDGTGWRVVDFLGTQSTRAELEAADAARAKAREKKAAQRAKKPSAPAAPAVPAVPGDVPGDDAPVPEDSADVPGYYTGKARPGQDRPGSTTGPATEQAQTAWPEVAVPGLRALPDSGTTADCHGCGWEHGHGAGCRYAS